MKTKITKEELERQLNLTPIEFTKQDIVLLMEGGHSTLKENIELENGVIKDAKIKIEIDKEGQIKLQYIFRQEEIKIPREMGGYKFSEEELDTLKNGKGIQFNYEGNPRYLQIDKELNAVTFKTQQEIKISEIINFEMGGYVFDEKQKQQLENGENITGIVMEGKEGFFVTSLRMTEDKKGWIFSEYKDLTKEKAEELLQKREATNKLENMASVVEKQELNYIKPLENINSIVKDNKVQEDLNTASVVTTNKEEKKLDRDEVKKQEGEQKEKEKTITPTLEQSKEELSKYEEKLYTAIQKNDFKEVTTLSENQPPVSMAFENKLTKDSTINSDQKLAAQTILGINPIEAKKEVKEKIEKTNDLKIENSTQENKDKKPTGHKRKAAKEIMDKAFGDM